MQKAWNRPRERRLLTREVSTLQLRTFFVLFHILSGRRHVQICNPHLVLVIEKAPKDHGLDVIPFHPICGSSAQELLLESGKKPSI